MAPHSPDHVPDDGDDADDAVEARNALFPDLYFGRGWSRHLPTAAIEILGAIMVHGPSTRSMIERHLSRFDELADGWAAPCWPPLDHYTDEQLRELREHFAGDPLLGADPDRAEDAATVMAEEAADRERHVADLDRSCHALGVAPARSMGELFELMLAAGVLVATDERSDPSYDLNAAAPLPGEVLALTDQQRAEDDRLRWRLLHEPTAQSIIRLFDPHGGDRQTIRRTSLQRLARDLDVDPESARAGVILLLEEGDFSASRDLDHVNDHQVFELTVDWDLFMRNRVRLRRAGADPA